MQNHNDVHPSININNGLLKNDRKAAGFTQVSFAAACDSVSLATIRRAEQGHRIIVSSLRRMGAVLNQDFERYIVADSPDVESEYVAWIEGEWLAYFVEADRRLLPYIVTVDISITQNANRIDGRWDYTTPTGKHVERLMDCKIQNNVLTGFTAVDGMGLAHGLSCLNQVVSRNNNWLEGFAIWYDTNTARTELSRSIGVKKNCRNFDQYIEEARFLIARELDNYRMRKLVEAGYSIRDAVTMLTAIDYPDG